MITIKRVIGTFILLFIAIPVLFGIIWAYGITRAIVSTDFISTLPQEIISELPLLVEDLSSDMGTRWHGLDEEERIWLNAYRESNTDLNKILSESGIEAWVRNDLQDSFLEIGAILRGEKPASDVELNMQPLKTALRSPVLINELSAIIAKLPPCNPVDDVWWQERLEQTVVSEGGYSLKLKPCRPANLENLPTALAIYFENKAAEIPDSVEMVHFDSDLPQGLNFTRWLSKSMILIFLIPAFFIFLGALIAANSRPSFLRWVGAPTLIGGGLVFLLTSAVTRYLPDLLWYSPDFQLKFHGYEFLSSRIYTFFSSISHHLFQPVNKVATIVCVIGIVLIALSFAFNTNKE